MYFIDRTVRNFKRIPELISILVKYGLEEIIVNTPLIRLISNQRIAQLVRRDKPLELNLWVRIRLVIEELGPTFIKLAQLLSNRPDLLPDNLIKEFEKLQDKVPPFSVLVAKQIIEEELGKPIDELFSYFDEQPLGSASIGQVYRAKLLNGDDVVVKVQRPKVNDKVKADLELLRQFVKLTENNFINAGILNPLEVVAAFEKSMLTELDYLSELRHMEQFRKLYGEHPKFYIPKPYQAFSTSRVLVIEFVSGCKVTDTERLLSWGIDPASLARTGMEIYLTQIFDFGFFHADPHPGNILVRPNGKIVLIDFGMVGKISKRQKFAFAGAFLSVAQRNPRGLAVNLRRLAVNSEIEEMKVFEADLNSLIEDFIIFDADNATMADFTRRLQKLIYRHRLEMPGSIFLILRALAILEGIGKVLNPTFDALEAIKPYGAKVLKEEFSFENISSDLYYSFTKLLSLGYNLPQETKDIIKKIRKGKLYINIEHHGYEPILHRFDVISKKLILAILIGAMLIASSISLNAPLSDSLTTSGGVSYISLIGFIMAGVLGFFLFISFFRNGD